MTTTRSTAAASRRLRRHLMLSACAMLVPAAAGAQTGQPTPPTTPTVDVAANRSTAVTVGGADTVVVRPNVTLAVNGLRAINFSSGATGAGPVIYNQGILQSTRTNSGDEGRAIDTQTSGGTAGFRNFTVYNYAGATISGVQDAIRILNTNVDTASLVRIDNAGTITSQIGQGVEVSTSLTSAQLNVLNRTGGEIIGIAGILASSATVDNYGTIRGTALVASGMGLTVSNGEAIRLNGSATSLASTITLYGGSVTTGTGSGANAIHVSAGTSTTVNVRSGATVNGDISIDSRIGIVNLDAGAVLNGNVDTDPGQMTVNLQAGATVTGQINGGAATTGLIDTLNLTGPGAATLPVITAFDRINVLSGTWTLVNQAFATAQGIGISAGATVRYGNGGTDGAFVGNIENNGALVYDRTNALGTSSVISGTGTLTIANTGTLGLSAPATYSGATTINAGSLRGDAVNAFSANSVVTIGADGTLATNDNAQTVANIGGSGRITTGTLTGGVLTTGGDNASSSYAGTVTGLGGIKKVGTGTLTLSGASTATGAFTAEGGTLLVTGSVNGSAAALSGATLGGSGTIAGAVSVADGASLNPGAGGVGTLTTGALTLAAGATLNFDLGTPGVAGGSDRIQVNGDLALNGTLNVADAGGFGQGVYRLIDYTGVRSGAGLAIGAFPAGTDAGLLAVQTNIVGQVNLVYGGSSADPLRFWDGAGPGGDGIIEGGSGSWTNAGTNWTDVDGTAFLAWNGNFAVFQGAAGTVTVNDAIALTGMQFVTSGYTVAAGSGSLTTSDAQTSLRVDPGATATVATGIGGSGGIVKNDAGTLILAAANTYAGATTVAGGTLRAAAAGALPGTTVLTVANGATLDVAASQTVGSLAGAGAVTLSGGSLTAGGLGANTTFSGTVAGNGGFAKAGSGTLTLTGANAWTGATTVDGGTLAITGAGRIGTGALSIASGALVNLNGIATNVGALTGEGRVTIGTDGRLTTTSDTNTAFAGQLTGTRAELVKAGTGTLTLSGAANTFSGTTTINGGTLVVTNAGALSNTGGVSVAAAGTLRIEADKTIGALTGSGVIQLGANRLTTGSAQNVTFAGAIGGTGGFTKAGTGTLTLAGANTYTGETIVSAGVLSLTGSVAGAASATGGATLGGTGSVAGTLTVADASIAPGANGVGLLTVGGLVLGANAILAYDLGAPGVPGASDRIQVNGNLTLAGTLNATDAGGFGQGVYRLIDYTGALTDNGLVVGTLPSGFVAGQTEVQTAVAGQVNLVVGGALPEIQFWDGAGTTGNGAVEGGSGSWNATTRNWTNAAGTQNAPWGGRFAVFQGAAGTVTVDAAIGFTGMQFVTSGYTIAAGTGALSATADTSTIRVDPGATATIAAAIGGSGGLQKLDSGTLILTGANGYAGATTVSGGTLRVGAGALPGTTAVTVANGATLDVAGAQTIASLAGAGSVTLSGGGLTTGDATGRTFEGVISGAGGLTKAGTGTFTLAGANSYTGGTTVAAGTLRLAGAGRLGGGALAVAAGATLDLNGVASGVGTLSGAGAITLGNATLSAGAGADSAFAGVISGTGGFTKTGAGNLTLSGANSYTGTTRVAGGTLTLANATAVPITAAVTIDQGATLALGSAKTIASLDGAGAVALGANTLTVTSGSFAGAINGSGGLAKAGAGTLTLSGVNGYTGATTVSGGTLALVAGGSIASSSGVALTGSGATLAVAGTQAIGALTGVAGAAVQLNGALTQTNAATVTFNGTLSGTGGFTKAGAGTYTLATANTHSGGTGVTAGILRAGAVGAFGTGVLSVDTGARAELANFAQTVGGLSGAGAVVLGSATLTIDAAGASSFDGVISGTGGVTKQGAGSLTLTGASTYTGATAVNAGALVVNGSLASAVTVATGARLGGNGTVGGLVVTGTLAPGNSIGTTTVNGNVTFAVGSTYQVEVDATGASDRTNASGTVTINGGTVQVLAAPGTYGAQTDYTILTGAGGVSGRFAAVTSDTAFLDPSLLYNANAVTLRLRRNNVSFASVAQTGNQLAVATALGATQSGALFNSVVTLNAATARAGFDALSGEIHATALTAANREVQAGQRPLLDRLATGTGEGLELWIQGAGSRVNVDGRDGFAGVDIGRIGVLGGLEYGSGAARVGIAGGYAVSDLDMDDRASDGKVRSARVAIYGGISSGGLRLRAGAGYQHHRVTTDRTVFVGALGDTPAASYSGNSVQAFGEVGYSIGGTVTIEPFAGISYARTKFDAATETGGVAALRLGGESVNSSVATLGVRFGTGGLGEGVRVDGLLAARRFLSDGRGTRDATFVGTGQGFTVAGADFGRTGGVARLGFSVPALGGRLGANVEGDFAKDAKDYGARVTAGWRF